MTGEQRRRFDELFEEVLEGLPERLHELMREIPVILDDRPSPKLLEELGMGSGELLCGLHSGISLTERSVEHSGVLPDEIRLFREGIVETAGGWDAQYAEDEVYEQIRITLLHEIGHHFGLDEDDLAGLGYD